MKKSRWAQAWLLGAICFALTGCGMTGKTTDTGTPEAAESQTAGTQEEETKSGEGQTAETQAFAMEEESETKTETQTEMETETEGNSRTVAIDAGHQGSWVDMSAQEPMAPGSEQTKAKATAGTTGSFSQVPEYELNLQVALVLRDELESRGYRVVMAREDNDTAISNKERAELATSEGADISVRIHANGSEDASVSGALTMSPSPSNPYLDAQVSADSYQLSQYILDAFCGATGLGNLGVMATDEMTGINWSTVPVTILEMGFMTNQQDDLYLTDQGNHPVMAQGIADGIDAYFASAETSAQAGDTAQEKTQAAVAETTEAETAEKTTEAETAEKTAEAGTAAETAAAEAGSTAETDAAENLTALTEILEEGYINALAQNGEKWAVAAEDLNSAGRCVINGDASMQSASVIKAFIMATVYERAVFAEEAGKDWIDMAESYDGELKELLTNMITVSDNEAANELVRRLGQGDFDAGAAVVNEFCQEHGYAATHLGRAFLAENPTDDNYTSAEDCCKLLAEIYRGELISADASGRMQELLEQQTRKNKIPAGLPEGVQSANKTGEMPAGYGLGTIENDIAIVLDAERPYVLCVLSNDIADNGAAQSTIVSISREVYQYMESGA